MYKTKKNSKIAYIGIRGIGITYSGFEEFAYQLAMALPKKNWYIVVYCRKKYFPAPKKMPKHIRMYYMSCIPHTLLETISHSLISTLHACFISKPDVILYFGIGSTLWTFIPRLFGIPTIVNTDGLDRKRKKWPIFAQLFLHASEYLATFLPVALITDSLYMQRYFHQTYHKKTQYIPYFFNPDVYKPFESMSNIEKLYDIRKHRYILWVGRIVPDNNIEEVVQAFSRLTTDYKLVIVGDDMYNTPYKQAIYTTYSLNKAIIFTGFLPQQRLIPLYSNAQVYVETKRSNGTHPSLIQAMTLCPMIISNNNLVNTAVLGSSASYYRAGSADDLKEKLQHILSHTPTHAQKMGTHAKKLVNKNYAARHIVKTYEELFSSLIQCSS